MSHRVVKQICFFKHPREKMLKEGASEETLSILLERRELDQFQSERIVHPARVVQRCDRLLMGMVAIRFNYRTEACAPQMRQAIHVDLERIGAVVLFVRIRQAYPLIIHVTSLLADLRHDHYMRQPFQRLGFTRANIAMVVDVTADLDDVVDELLVRFGNPHVPLGGVVGIPGVAYLGHVAFERDRLLGHQCIHDTSLQRRWYVAEGNPLYALSLKGHKEKGSEDPYP